MSAYHFGKEIKAKIAFVEDGIIPEDVNDRTITSKTIETIISKEVNRQLDNPFDGSDETTYTNYRRLFIQLGIIS